MIRVAEHGRIYGVEIEKTNEYGRQERALIAGISEEKKETQYFLERLWCGAAMPAELNALYDDYIGEKEWQDDRGIYAAC